MSDLRTRPSSTSDQGRIHTSTSSIEEARTGAATICFNRLNQDRQTADDLIRKGFHLKVDSAFYAFFDFCCSLNTSDPLHPFECLKQDELELVGPFEALIKIPENPLTQHRYFYDIPEVVTVLQSVNSDLHYTLLRDDPADVYSAVLCNEPSKSGRFYYCGDNIFVALVVHLRTSVRNQKTPHRGIKTNTALNTNNGQHLWVQSSSSRLEVKIRDYCATHNIPLDSADCRSSWDLRMKSLVATDFSGIGVRVPCCSATEVGFRELPLSLPQLKRLLDKYRKDKQDKEAKKQLFDIINYANIANDECDFGTSLQLGRCLFISDTSEDDILALTKLSQICLENAYNLLERASFAEVLKAHIRLERGRKKANNA